MRPFILAKPLNFSFHRNPNPLRQTELHSLSCLEQLSPARARLVAQHGVVGEHPDDDGPFGQRLDLVGGPRLSGGRVVDDRRAGCAALRTSRRAAGQPEHRDQEGGGRRRRASGGGWHRFSLGHQGVRPRAQRVHRRGAGSAGTAGSLLRGGSGPALFARGHGSGASRSPLAPFPVVEPGVDGDGNADQSDGDQDPAQGVEVGHQRLDRGLGFRKDLL